MVGKNSTPHNTKYPNRTKGAKRPDIMIAAITGSLKRAAVKWKHALTSPVDHLIMHRYTRYIILYMYEMGKMKSISYTSARSNLAKTMAQVCEDHAPVAITRKGEGAVVMISMADYQSLEETAYLLRSPKNTRRLIQSIAELEDGKGKKRELIE